MKTLFKGEKPKTLTEWLFVNGLTLFELSAEIGVSHTNICHVKAGRRKLSERVKLLLRERIGYDVEVV